MITIYVSNQSAMVEVLSSFSNETFWATYTDNQFYCKNVKPQIPGNLTSFVLNSMNEDDILYQALEAAKSSTYQGKQVIVGQGIFNNSKEEDKSTLTFNLKQYFKGTTFGGVTENAFGFVAALLKAGLGNTEIHIGVKFKWTASDLLKYINAIQERTLKVQTA
jgi:hypothetical protein